MFFPCQTEKVLVRLSSARLAFSGAPTIARKLDIQLGFGDALETAAAGSAYL
jgi:hypothetical protein